jgi:hypothetical protein
MTSQKSTLSAGVFAAGLVVLGGMNGNAQTLELQLKASNYDPGTGGWTDASGLGNNATFAGAPLLNPTLSLGATPNGLAAVSLLGGTSAFTLQNSLAGASGYTIFAYCEIASTTSNNSGNADSVNALTGSTLNENVGGALEYNVNSGLQDATVEYGNDIVSGTATLSTSSFSLMDLAIDGSGSSVRLNGAADGTGSGMTFGVGDDIDTIGNDTSDIQGFYGEIAEIDIYSGVLTDPQLVSFENGLIAEYGQVPEPNAGIMLAGGLLTLVAVGRLRRA